MLRRWRFSKVDNRNANLKDATENPSSSDITSSVISNVQNLSISSAAFSVTQAAAVIQNQHPVDDSQGVLNWLSPINYRIIQNDTFSKHTAGTGSWFIEHPKFQGWLSDTIPVLCARGPPGVGKTILSSIVIRYLETSFTVTDNRDSIAIVFAYCRYTGHLSITDILACFIKQLVERHPRVLSPVEGVYKKHFKDATRPIEEDWLELLQTIIQSFTRAYIVIDALDEFPDNARDGLLNALTSLKASLLVTSRPSNAFHLLKNIEFIEIGDENGPGKDIEFFIHQSFKESSNLANLLRRKEQVRWEICTQLKETSKSMFLLAALQIESLKDSTTVSKLRKAANSLSSDMDDVYSASWERIKAQSKPRALLAEAAIIWLTHAYRPLTITELQHALAVPCDGETFDTEDVADEGTIISVSCGLITIEKESRIVRLVHFTALDFFRRLGHNLCSKPHTSLSTWCLSYLAASQFTPKKISTREELEIFLTGEAYPLRSYAYHHWGSHAGRCYKEGGTPKAISEFLLHCGHYPCLIEGGKFDLFERCHVAVYYGIRDKFALSNEWWNQPTLLMKSTPLTLACGRGNVDIVESILSHDNINVNAQNKDGETPLMLASGNGNVPVVKMLLAMTDIGVNIQSTHGTTALMLASGNGHDAVVELLLSQLTVSINTQRDDGHTALTVAKANGHEAVVELLLSQPTINVDTRQKDDWTIIRHTQSTKSHEKQPDWSAEFNDLPPSPDFVKHGVAGTLSSTADNTIPLWRRTLKGVKLQSGNEVANLSSHMRLKEPTSSGAYHHSSLYGWIDSGSIFATPTQLAKSPEMHPNWCAEFNGRVRRALKINLISRISHENSVLSVRFSPDGKYLAAGCRNGTAYIYDVKTGRQKRSLADKSTRELSVRIVCFNIDNKYLATAGSDRGIRVWIIAKNYTQNVFKGHEDVINAMDFSSNSQILVSCSDDRTVRVWRMRDGSTRVFTAGYGIWSSQLSPDERYVACGCNPWSLLIWDMRTGRLVQEWNGHKEPVASVGFTPDGKRLVTASWDKTLKHWDVGSLGSRSGPEGSSRIETDVQQNGEKHVKKISTFNGHTDCVNSVSVSPDGQWIASGSWDDTVRIWRLHNATMECILHGHKDVVWSVDFSPVGGYLATAGGDHQLALWGYDSN